MARIKINELPAIAGVVSTTEFAADDIGQTGQTAKVTGQQLQDFISLGAGNITIVGTPVDNQVMVWASASSAEGDANFTWNGSTLAITGNITVTGTVDGVDVSSIISATETNVVSALNGATLTDVGTPAATDRILLQDASDSNNLKYADFSEFGGGGGSFNNFTLAGDSGPNQTVDDAETVTISGGTNATTVASATNTITINVDDAFLSNAGDVGTGVYDFGGATSFELPNSTAPTVDAAGEIALDTNGVAPITDGVFRIHDGTRVQNIVSARNLPASDNDVPAFDSATGSIQWQAQSGAGGGISNVVEDTTPQLGGNLDANTFNVDFDDNTGIRDSNGNEQLIFQQTASAVNHIEITNAATANDPIIAAAGDDTNVDLTLQAKGTGVVQVGTEEVITEAAAQQLSNKTLDAVTLEGVVNAGAATSLEIPNGAAPVVNAAGEIAVDTTITDYTGMIKYHDGTEELTVLAVPTANLSTTNGQVPAYNATNNELEFVTPAGGGNVSNTGTPVDNQLAVWTNATTIEGDSQLTWSGLDFSIHVAQDDGNPFFNFGASATNDLSIQANYESASQILDFVQFTTSTTSATADAGRYIFAVDDTDRFTIDDGGIEVTGEVDIGGGRLSSDHSIRYVSIEVFAPTTNITTGDTKKIVHIPAGLNGMNLISVHAEVNTAGTTGTTDIQVHNRTQAADMLSTVITIDSGETGSDTAATPPVIDTANDDIATNDVIRIDVDAVSSTPPQGLIVTLGFQLP